jgi:hypothetical protein
MFSFGSQAVEVRSCLMELYRDMLHLHGCSTWLPYHVLLLMQVVALCRY